MSRALKALEHRGPDGVGKWVSAPAALGHRRLAIIDIAESTQPMMDPAQRFVLSYNGEIYNYQELRENLSPRWEFRTAGDTEVLLAGLANFGADFCRQVEGMWAFALWDRHNRTLLMGRDRMGKKPLYFTRTRHGFACGSELPALALLTPPWEDDLDSTADYFRYGYCLPGTTIYRGVFELLPGHIAKWHPHADDVHQEPYWTLGFKPFEGDRAQAKEQLSLTLMQAVKRRLVADVEVGAFLSGGVDSSLIVALMAQVFGQRPKTFTIGFPETSYDEREPARIVSEHLATEHYESNLKGLDPAALEHLVLQHVGQPFADSSLLPTALVAQLAAEHVKVALSGDGGDEVFSGYQRYQARVLMRWYTRLPNLLRTNLQRILRAIPEPMTHHSSSLLKKAQMFCDAAHRYENERPYTVPAFYSQDEFACLAPDLAPRGHTPRGLPEETNLDDIHTMMATDALIYLPQDILTKVDRATMAFSLEARAPFLDTAVVELAFRLPRKWHRRGFSGKRMLYETFRDKLPRAIWQRRKQGFAVPVNEWFRGTVGDTLLALLREQHTPLSSRQVEFLLNGHRIGRKDSGHPLWSIYIYLIWKQAHLLRRPSYAQDCVLSA